MQPVCQNHNSLQQCCCTAHHGLKLVRYYTFSDVAYSWDVFHPHCTAHHRFSQPISSSWLTHKYHSYPRCLAGEDVLERDLERSVGS